MGFLAALMLGWVILGGGGTFRGVIIRGVFLSGFPVEGVRV